MRSHEWSRRESNPRPLECDSSALPTELRPHRREETKQNRAYSLTPLTRQPVLASQPDGSLVAILPGVAEGHGHSPGEAPLFQPSAFRPVRAAGNVVAWLRSHAEARRLQQRQHRIERALIARELAPGELALRSLVRGQAGEKCGVCGRTEALQPLPEPDRMAGDQCEAA